MSKVDLFNILKRKFPEGQYALMAEVRDKAGFSANRSADYMAVGLWPSRGLAINGIEVKSYRNDWLSELKKPEKAENIYKYCDYWWLLTTEDNVAKIEEIPETWGWMYLKGSILKIAKEAPKLTPVAPSKDILATMLKRATNRDGFIRKSEVQPEIDAALQKGKDHNKYLLEQLEKTNGKLTERIEQFEKATGVDLTHYYRYKTNPIKIGQAVKFISEGKTDDIKKDLLDLQKSAQDILKEITRGIDLLNIKIQE